MTVTRNEDGSSSWTCGRCKDEVTRYRGQSDVDCPNCGACYNASGQRLRDDWRNNRSSWDDDCGDMEGFEEQQCRRDAEIENSY
jgi:hypothetical protein